ncbi:MAG: ATP-binding protein [Phycisphaerales bacterium]
MNPAEQEFSRPVGNWWLVFSLALGGIVLGVFMPVFLLVSALAILAIPVLAAMDARAAERLRLRQETTADQSALHARNAELLRGVINAADIPILATDEEGVLAHTNARSRAVLGISASMLGRRFDELMTQGVLHELESLARQGEAGHARAGVPIRGEMRDFDVSADPVPISKGAVIAFRDITELSRAMTLKADFAANASHELRTPIASIKAAAETLMGPARSDEAMSGRLIEMISNNANRLEMLACDLLDLSRLEAEDQPAEIDDVDLGDLIEKVIADFTPAAERRRLTIVAEIEPGLETVRTDAGLMMLILRNLVQNATKFAREGTVVRIAAQRQRVGVDRAAPVPAGLDGASGVSLRVIDKGIGIPLAHQQRVFERFYQVDEARTGSGARRGTGLGLAIVKHAARRLGGTVMLESVYQTGTTMIVDLPRCADAEETPEPRLGVDRRGGEPE